MKEENQLEVLERSKMLSILRSFQSTIESNIEFVMQGIWCMIWQALERNEFLSVFEDILQVIKNSINDITTSEEQSAPSTEDPSNTAKLSASEGTFSWVRSSIC